MKVWVVLAVAVVLWACSTSMVEPRSNITAIKDDEHKLITVKRIVFSTETATRLNYMLFMSELRSALLESGNTSGSVALLPPQTMSLTDPRRYLLVDLTNGEHTVTLALDVTNVYVLGYHAIGTSSTSYFFINVPVEVQEVLFPDFERQTLSYTGDYDSLEAVARVADRSKVPLGIGELRQHIQNMNFYLPTGDDRYHIARALLVCVQMVSEAARFRNIQQQIADLAEPLSPDQTYGVLYPDALMMEFQNSWRNISTAVQSATNGIFGTTVRLPYDGKELVFDTVASVRFIVAVMLVMCPKKGDNLQFLQMPSSSSLPFAMAMRSTGVKDNNNDPCAPVVAPTTQIIGQNGLCFDITPTGYDNGNSIVLRECNQTKRTQLWTFRSDSNTIQSGGKCLTAYAYRPGAYVMIYNCGTAVPEATKWEIGSDGSIKNPISGLVLSASKNASGTTCLYMEKYINASNQAFHPSNNTKPTVTTIVGYQGLCLTASRSDVWLGECGNNFVGQEWAIYPDGSIRPQKDLNGCLKYYATAVAADLVIVGTCSGGIEERWLFQNDGTILHAVTHQVMDVLDTSATPLQMTVNNYIHQRFSQIWFQVQP